MRIFVGIPMSEELRGRVSVWRQNFQFPHLRQGFGGQAISNFQTRWVELKNLHVTLVAPWAEEDIERVKRLLRSARNDREVEPFEIEIRFDNISFGPNIREPRMVWASGQAGEEIKKLKKLIGIALGGIVDDSRGRAFYQHVTLARLKLSGDSNHSVPLWRDTPPQQGGDAPRLSEDIDWRMKVEKFVLYESHLLPQGADYEVLEEFKFGL
jgi:2'-5' RNA ligase